MGPSAWRLHRYRVAALCRHPELGMPLGGSFRCEKTLRSGRACVRGSRRMSNDLSGEQHWRHGRRYAPEVPADRAVLADLEQRLAGLHLIDTPVWVYDTERCQALWANAAGLDPGASGEVLLPTSAVAHATKR